MSFWSRLFGSEPQQPAAPEPAPSQASAPPTQAAPQPPDTLLLLSRIGYPGGPSEAQALQALRSLAHTPHEAAALDALTGALIRGPLPESLRMACADLLVERGDRPAAVRLLAGASSIPALMLRADLLRDSGEVGQAVSLVERVLARNIDTPGARERHQRWSRELSGGSAPAPPRSRDETIAVPTAQQSPFRIVREIARGGAGTVYLAHDDLLHRQIALKVYHRPREDAGQLRREATTAVRFACPGVIRVLDVDYDQGWIALEWIETGSLRELISARRVDWLTPFAAWVVPLAESLALLHHDGWVHADIKPANVLVRAKGRPVLGDFGIAVTTGSAALGGSTGFLSPERLSGRPLDPSDDVYGFGRVLEEVAACLPPTDETRWYASLAERCMSDAATRPADALALLRLLQPPGRTA